MELIAQIIEYYQGGASLRQCAEKFGVERRKIKSLLEVAGIPVKSKAKIIEEQFSGAPWRNQELMIHLYVNQGLSTYQIASEFGCDRSVVCDWLARFGVALRTTAETQKGKTPSNKGQGKRNSTEMVLCACGCGALIKRFNIGSNEVRFIDGHRIKGEAHPLYKPFSPNKSNRHEGSDYRAWRRAVLKESKYTCFGCGKIGGKLHSHHVSPVAVRPYMTLEIENGKAMCHECHKALHMAFMEIFK